jgi:hypothetical protein
MFGSASLPDGYIYLLQTPESNVYKIGRHDHNNCSRFENIPMDSILLLHENCCDSHTVVRNIIGSFDKEFTNMWPHGDFPHSMYFKGDPEDMKVLIRSIIAETAKIDVRKDPKRKYDAQYYAQLEADEDAQSDAKYCAEYYANEDEADEDSPRPTNVRLTIEKAARIKLMLADVRGKVKTRTVSNRPRPPQTNHVIIPEDPKITCSKCNKTNFTTVAILRRHEKTCDGCDKKQCKLCLQLFLTRQGKHRHICKPVQLQSTTVYITPPALSE